MKNVLGFSLLLLIVTAGCGVKVDSEQVNAQSFIHTAYFWFKAEATEAQIQAFKADSERLAEIETVKFFHAGEPAPTDRPVIENSYDWAIVFHFKDLAAQEFYQKAPLHLEMIEKHQSIWEKVMVTDISNE